MTPKEAIKAKIAIYDELVRDSRARAVDLRVAWLLLFKYLNAESGLAWPSASTMAMETSISVRAVRRSIRWLTVPGGYFTKTKGGGRGHSNQYTPNLERVTAESPINEERVTQLAVKGDTAGRKRVTLESPEPLEEPKEELCAREVLASPPDGGSHLSAWKISKKEVRQGNGERRDVGAQLSGVDEKRFTSGRHRDPARWGVPPDFKWVRDQGAHMIFRHGDTEHHVPILKGKKTVVVKLPAKKLSSADRVAFWQEQTVVMDQVLEAANG